MPMCAAEKRQKQKPREKRAAEEKNKSETLTEECSLKHPFVQKGVLWRRIRTNCRAAVNARAAHKKYVVRRSGGPGSPAFVYSTRCADRIVAVRVAMAHSACHTASAVPRHGRACVCDCYLWCNATRGGRVRCDGEKCCAGDASCVVSCRFPCQHPRFPVAGRLPAHEGPRPSPAQSSTHHPTLFHFHAVPPPHASTAQRLHARGPPVCRLAVREFLHAGSCRPTTTTTTTTTTTWSARARACVQRTNYPQLQ